jgi:hypothetical protein
MMVIVGMEESQVICEAFRAKGHTAYSCDLKPCSGSHPEWHIVGDIFQVMNCGLCFDLGIFHPDCTFLTVSNNSAMNNGCSKYTAKQARKYRAEAVDNFLKCEAFDIEKIALENPIGIMSSLFKKPDQIIQPYQFGHDASKKTCLWLKGLPLLKPTKYIEPRTINGLKRWGNQTDSGQNRLGPSEDRATIRAKTYPGIAKAMAEQWG